MPDSGLLFWATLYSLAPLSLQYCGSDLFIQEVIQNAEDAGATKVIFLIDHTTYGTSAELLYDQLLSQFQVRAKCFCCCGRFA